MHAMITGASSGIGEALDSAPKAGMAAASESLDTLDGRGRLNYPTNMCGPHPSIVIALLSSCSLFLGCGTSTEPLETDVAQDTTEASGGESPPPEVTSPAGPDLRALAADATFGDLLGAARTLDQRRDQESNAGCLVRRGWRLEADLASAIRPVPEPPEDLDTRLAADGDPVNVLSRWGAYGSGAPERTTFAAVTTTLPPRTEPALVWVVTDADGVYVRSTQATAASPSPVADVSLAASLAAVRAAGVLYVAAEAGVPLERVATVLALIPDALAGRVGLAVSLEAGTRLPEPPEAQPSDAAEAVCPDGLPPLPAGAANGRLAPTRIVQSLTPLRQGIQACVSTSDGPGAAGARVVMAMRIGPDGRVAHACVSEDDANDAGLLVCLVRAARANAFPAPDPPGFVDVSLPLVLAPLESQRQRALCR